MPVQIRAAPSDFSRFVHRELVILLVLSGVAAVTFLATKELARNAAAQQATDAEAWYRRGMANATAGRSAEAVQALRRAVAGRRDSWPYAQALSDALVRDGQPDAALQLLLLWSTAQPGNPSVNTSLARLEARAGNVETAISYYESALYGRWSEGADQARLNLRRELIQFLLQHRDRGRALSQVLALSANQADEPATHIETGRLFLAAGDPARALDQFERAAQLDRANPEASLGIAEAAFEQEDYPRVAAVLGANPDPRALRLARIARGVIDSDPLAPRLSASERYRRLSTMLADAELRVRECQSTAAQPAGSGLVAVADQIATFRAALRLRTIDRTPDTIADGLSLAGSALVSATRTCPADERADVLMRVARRHPSPES